MGDWTLVGLLALLPAADLVFLDVEKPGGDRFDLLRAAAAPRTDSKRAAYPVELG